MPEHAALDHCKNELFKLLQGTSPATSSQASLQNYFIDNMYSNKSTQELLLPVYNHKESPPTGQMQMWELNHSSAAWESRRSNSHLESLVKGQNSSVCGMDEYTHSVRNNNVDMSVRQPNTPRKQQREVQVHSHEASAIHVMSPGSTATKESTAPTESQEVSLARVLKEERQRGEKEAQTNTRCPENTCFQTKDGRVTLSPETMLSAQRDWTAGKVLIMRDLSEQQTITSQPTAAGSVASGCAFSHQGESVSRSSLDLGDGNSKGKIDLSPLEQCMGHFGQDSDAETQEEDVYSVQDSAMERKLDEELKPSPSLLPNPWTCPPVDIADFCFSSTVESEWPFSEELLLSEKGMLKENDEK